MFLHAKYSMKSLPIPKNRNSFDRNRSTSTLNSRLKITLPSMSNKKDDASKILKNDILKTTIQKASINDLLRTKKLYQDDYSLID